MSKIKQSDAGRIRYSIASKLNRKMFFRLFWLFVSINVLICIITCVGLWLYSERKIASAAMLIEERELPEDGVWQEISGITIVLSPYVDAVSDYDLTWPLPWPKPHELMDQIYRRGFRAAPDDFDNTLRSIDYVVSIRYGNVMQEISLNIGPFILYFVYLFFVLLAFELLTLLLRTIRDRGMVRRTLDPIAELARTAQTLNDVNKQLDHEMSMALAGKLDGIDAGRLDIRIPVDDLQEELKNVAVAINGMLDRINSSYAAQARFVSDASHELRTPIAVIQGYANLLDRWGKEDEKALTESVDAIKDEAENMKGLVEQLLFLARGDSNRIRLTEERITLKELITEVADEARMLDDSYEFKTVGGDVAILADRSLIKQALRILVDNAVKYTDPGGEITISAAIEGEMARVSVADTGIGIRSDILPRVFDRFVRADESRARATGGAGLGLSIAQWIVSRHSGHMDVLSREGIGTRISLILPLAPPPDKTEMIAQNAEITIGSVEDNNPLQNSAGDK